MDDEIITLKESEQLLSTNTLQWSTKLTRNLGFYQIGGLKEVAIGRFIIERHRNNIKSIDMVIFIIFPFYMNKIHVLFSKRIINC